MKSFLGGWRRRWRRWLWMLPVQPCYECGRLFWCRWDLWWTIGPTRDDRGNWYWPGNCVDHCSRRCADEELARYAPYKPVIAMRGAEEMQRALREVCDRVRALDSTSVEDLRRFISTGTFASVSATVTADDKRLAVDYPAPPASTPVVRTIQPWEGRMYGSITPDEIESRFKHHPPKDEQLVKYDDVRTGCKALATLIVQQTPAGREQALALTKLEEVMFHANSAIARRS